MSETILKVPIQINGGEGAPTTKLEDRELYLDLLSGRLYAGGIQLQDFSTIRAGAADRLINSRINIDATLGDSNAKFQLGNMYYDFSNNKFTGTYPGAYSIERAKLTDIQRLVLSSGCYGYSLPSSGEQGQLFFKIG